MKTINIELLNKMIVDGYVKKNKHPHADLYLYNYTQTTQFERIWNEVTLQCRGLILDKNHNIIARPFKKFFNLGEQKDLILPNEHFKVYEKMDGSLGILYWINDRPFIATRGSFTSDQSIVANEMLNTDYKDCIKYLDKSKTYLFEIIYPANRIVVDYGGSRNLTLLAIIRNESGEELPLENIGFPVVKTYNYNNNINELTSLEEDNREGFVIKYVSGLRLKVKFKEYLRLHKIVTQVSSYSVWEILRDEVNIEEFIQNVPDEFYQWIHQQKQKLNLAYKAIENIALDEYKLLGSRKETAAYFLNCTYPAIMFAMLDNKSYRSTIWKLIKPKYERPFREGYLD